MNKERFTKYIKGIVKSFIVLTLLIAISILLAELATYILMLIGLGDAMAMLIGYNTILILIVSVVTNYPIKIE